jgi:hypothetical protein
MHNSNLKRPGSKNKGLKDREVRVYSTLFFLKKKKKKKIFRKKSFRP